MGVFVRPRTAVTIVTTCSQAVVGVGVEPVWQQVGDPFGPFATAILLQSHCCHN